MYTRTSQIAFKTFPPLSLWTCQPQPNSSMMDKRSFSILSVEVSFSLFIFGGSTNSVRIILAKAFVFGWVLSVCSSIFIIISIALYPMSNPVDNGRFKEDTSILFFSFPTVIILILSTLSMFIFLERNSVRRSSYVATLGTSMTVLFITDFTPCFMETKTGTAAI